MLQKTAAHAVLCMQVQLQYPAPAGRPGGPRPDMQPGSDLPAIADGAQRPSFGDLLAASLCQASESRIWFEAPKKYLLARQTRCPASLPQVGPGILRSGLRFRVQAPTKHLLARQRRLPAPLPQVRPGF